MQDATEQGTITTSQLYRYRPLYSLMQVGFFLIGSAFWIDSMTGGNSFTASTWGSMAYSVPSKAWAAWMLASSVVTFVGLVKPVNNQYVLTGALMHVAQFSALSYSAAFSGGVFVIALYSSVIFLPMYGWLMFEAVRRG